VTDKDSAIQAKASESNPTPKRAWSFPNARHQILFWGLALSGLGLDLWTKKAIFMRLSRNGHIDVIDHFMRFILAENDGAAFSLASGQQHLLVTVSTVALFAVLCLFLLGQTRSTLMTICLGLFAGGISGNLWDRVFNEGRVRDFIDVYVGAYHWPTFNIADSLLCIAVGLMLISTLFTPTGQPDPARAQPQK